MRRFLFSLALCPCLALADYGSVRVDAITSVIDGDTFRATINDWPPVIGDRIPIRIADIDAPEHRSRCDTEAEKERKRELAADARIYLVERLRGAEVIELRNIQRGSFFRVIAEVWTDGENVGDDMLAAGHAIPFRAGQAERVSVDYKTTRWRKRWNSAAGSAYADARRAVAS